MTNYKHIIKYLTLAVFSLFCASQSVAQVANQECEVIDFNQFSHGDAIQSLSLFSGTFTLNVNTVRNDPAGTPDATAYDTERWDALNPPPNSTHYDTQLSFLCNDAANGGLGNCDGIEAVIPDVNFDINGDDTQGGTITFTSTGGDFEILRYNAVDSDNFNRRIILTVGGNVVGEATVFGNGSVITVVTDDHRTTQAEFEFLGSGGIDDIEVCRFVENAALGDRVWEDLNVNGVQDCSDTNANGILGDAGDTGDECDAAGIAGVPVTLFQTNPSGDCTSSTGMQMMTDADGFYLFEDLTPGNYCVQFGQPPAGFCDTADFELGAPKFTALNIGPDPEKDSDADPADDGRTDDLALAAGETNRTLDAGFVCPAKIGDRVWTDDNPENGIQDTGEGNVVDVTVKLYECTGGNAIVNDTKLIRTTTTDGSVDGMNYMFGAEPGFDLPPGEYFVQFVKPAGSTFTLPNQGMDDTVDSDCSIDEGTTACTTVGSREIDLSLDCGIIPPPPPECEIDLDKKCRVEPQPPVDIAKCKGKLQQFTLVWDGPDGMTIDAVNMGTTDAGGTVNNGDTVTFIGPYVSNDVIVDISSGSVTGQSTFHVSCSDEDFSGSDDCGKLAGNGKDNNGGFINQWLLEGFVDANGQVLDCNPVVTGGDFSENCSFRPSPANCDTLGKPKTLTFEYTGGGCPGDNDQGDKSKCSGAVLGTEIASITVNTADGYMAPLSVAPGGSFTVTRGGQDFKANTDIDLSNSGGTQPNDVHTSCSAPLAVGDEFGAITLVAINDQTGGVDVTYQYVVTNNGDPLTGVTVTDSILGDIAGPIGLASNDSRTFTEMATINDTTINIGTASGTLVADDSVSCSASDTVTVGAEAPPPCVVTGAPTIKLDRKKLEWKIMNAGTLPVMIDKIGISWPNNVNGALDKVKSGRHEIVSADQSGPTAVIDTFVGDPKHLKIDPGKTVTLKFEFKKNVSKTVGDYDVKIGFAEGCEVEL